MTDHNDLAERIERAEAEIERLRHEERVVYEAVAGDETIDPVVSVTIFNGHGYYEIDPASWHKLVIRRLERGGHMKGQPND